MGHLRRCRASFWAMPVYGFCLFLGSTAFAKEQERLLESSRALGRGNTFVAYYDSDEATRANPATLAETKITYQLRPLQLDVFLGENTLGSIRQMADLSAEANAVSLLRSFKDKFGKRQYGRIQIMPLAQRLGGFELAPFISSTNFIDMRTPAIPQAEFHSDTLYGVVLGYGFMVGKQLSIGIGLKPAQRLRYAGQVAFADILDFVDDSDFALSDLFKRQTGSIVAADIGAVWTPDKAWRFGLLIENLGYSDAVDSPESKPKAIAQRVDLGGNYRIDWKPWHWDFLVDVQDMLNAQKLNAFRLLHVGSEIGRSYLSRDHDIGLMAGLSEGYFTGGGFVDFYMARLTLSYYAAELGEYPGQRHDRRFALTLQTAASF